MTTLNDRQRAAWLRFAGPDLAAFGMGGRSAAAGQLRLSDAERAEVADRLSRHYSEGRLDKAELDERLSRAMAAKTAADLSGLFDDLPELPPAPGDDDDAAGAPPAYLGSRYPGRRGGLPAGRALGIAGVVLAAWIALHVVAAVAWHLLAWTAPLIWIAVVVLLVAALRRHHHHHHSHHHDHHRY